MSEGQNVVPISSSKPWEPPKGVPSFPTPISAEEADHVVLQIDNQTKRFYLVPVSAMTVWSNGDAAPIPHALGRYGLPMEAALDLYKRLDKLLALHGGFKGEQTMSVTPQPQE